MTFASSVSGAFDATGSTLIMGVLATGVSLGVAAGSAQAEDVLNALPDGVAMDGFDVVAYFDSAPAKSDTAYEVDYKGATLLFSSAENASAFAADPVRYEPRHNGWFSYAVSEGYGAEVDFVDGWAVLDDKLYLNWDAETFDAFVDGQSSHISQAEANLPDLHAGLQDGSADMYNHAGVGADIAHPQQLN